MFTTRDQNILVESHLNLARKVAIKIASHSSCPFEYKEMEQQAFLSLTQASRSFDPDRGIKFSTFASSRIRGNLLNYIRDKWTAVRLPRRGYEVYSKVSKLERRGLKRKEIATLIGLSEREVEDSYRSAQNCFCLSLTDSDFGREKTYRMPLEPLPELPISLMENPLIIDWQNGIVRDKGALRRLIRDHFLFFQAVEG